MSTFAIGAIINKGVSMMNPDECFVNVGVWNGFTFISGMVNNEDKTCIGIDNFSQFGDPRDAFLKRFNKYKSPRHHFFDMDYEEYFKKEHKGKIGFYIYDGNHAYRDQLLGLEIAEPYFSDNCIILIDDINCKEPYDATIEFAKKSENKYVILLEKKNKMQLPSYFLEWNHASPKDFMILTYVITAFDLSKFELTIPKLHTLRRSNHANLVKSLYEVDSTIDKMMQKNNYS